MKLKLIDYLRYDTQENFELKLVVFTNIIAALLALFSIFTGELLANIDTANISPTQNKLTYNSFFWLGVLLISLFLAEIALRKNLFSLSRRLSVYIYTFIIIPLGLFITSSISITSLYYLLCIILLNIIATTREKYIVNIFLMALIYAYIIMYFQFPQYLLPEPDRKITYVHFLIDTPIVIALTICVINGLLRTYRREQEKIVLQNNKLEQLARTDSLTGLYNKSYLNEQLSQLLTEAAIKKIPLAFFIIDIDFFKNYNIFYGNLKGDSCLIEVSRIIKKNCSNITKNIFRFGGEEFAIIIEDCDDEGARILAESIREDMHIAQLDNYRSTICNYITVSIGICCYDSKTPTSAEEIIKKTDSALYTVKRQGRDNYHIENSTG